MVTVRVFMFLGLGLGLGLVTVNGKAKRRIGALHQMTANAIIKTGDSFVRIARPVVPSNIVEANGEDSVNARGIHRKVCGDIDRFLHSVTRLHASKLASTSFFVYFTHKGNHLLSSKSIDNADATKLQQVVNASERSARAETRKRGCDA